MRPFSRLAAVTIATLCALGTADGRAQVINGTFTGTMDGGVDTYNYFGLGAVDLSGTAITGTFSYDPATFSSTTCTIIPGEGCYNGAITITETVAGGNTLTFHGNAAPLVGGFVIYGPLAVATTDQFTAVSDDPVSNIGMDGSTLKFVSSTTDFITAAPGAAPALAFSLTSGQMDTSVSRGDISLVSSGPESLSFNFRSGSVQVGTDVPEPGSLALMAAGLAAMILRRRRLTC